MSVFIGHLSSVSCTPVITAAMISVLCLLPELCDFLRCALRIIVSE